MLCAAGCQQSQSQFQRIALLPANVLLPPGSDWLRNAVPLILQQDLASDSAAYAFAAPDSSAAYAARATQELQTTIDGSRQLQVTADVRDLASQQTSRTWRVDSSGAIVSAVNALAKRLYPNAAGFSTTNDNALRAYVDSLQSSVLAERVAKLQDAIRADPNFGLAYVSLIEIEAQSDSSDLPETISAASDHKSRFVPYDRTRLDLMVARSLHATLATVANAAAAVTQVAPHDGDALAALGQVRFLQGNAAAGGQALSRALELNPASSQLRQDLAMGFLETRQFAQAEEAWHGSSGTGLNSATAVLLSGDRSRAASVLETSLQAPGGAGNPLAPVVRAQWAAIGGADVASGPQRGLALLRNQTSGVPDVVSLAAAQSAIWFQQSGDNASARSSAAQALQLAANPSIKETAQIVSLIVDAGSASALKSRIDAIHGGDRAKNLVLGYGLFLYGDFAGSAAKWQAIVTASGDTDLRSRTMLAACLHRAGNNAAAFGIVVEPFVPNLSGTDPFATIAFNEMRQLLRL